jgi:hypothetical protein
MPDHAIPARTERPWRILVLDRDPADPKWLLATVAIAGDVRPAVLDAAGRHADWAEVTAWVKETLGQDVALVPAPRRSGVAGGPAPSLRLSAVSPKGGTTQIPPGYARSFARVGTGAANSRNCPDRAGQRRPEGPPPPGRSPPALTDELTAPEAVGRQHVSLYGSRVDPTLDPYLVRADASLSS